jgi:pectate lyase
MIFKGPNIGPANDTPQLILSIGNLDFEGYYYGNGVYKTRFSPKAVGEWSYVTRSTIPAFDHKTGGFTSVPETTLVGASDAIQHDNWWTDLIDPKFKEGPHSGAKTVNVWRRQYLQDFAQRMDRCLKKIDKQRERTMTLAKTMLLSVFLMYNAGILYSQQIAFPGAEGYGKYSKGGRGGDVYEVTNLNDNGKGSLREAVEASGPRTVVFRVSGTIILDSPLSIKNPYITIAGQTAPGDGICIRRHPLNIGADHVIIRYLRVRLGDESGNDYDAVSSRYTKHLILDHISASWSVDECVSIYHCDSITVQWCLISESMSKSNHVKGSHGFGGIWGSNHGTYHHNLLAHHSSRNPRMASGSGNTDYRNNVIYNWGYQSLYGGEKFQQGNDKFNFSNFNIVANHYKPGPATRPGEVMYRIANPSYRSEVDYGQWYITENVVEGNEIVSADNWNGGVQTSPLIKSNLKSPGHPCPSPNKRQKKPTKLFWKMPGPIYPKEMLLMNVFSKR